MPRFFSLACVVLFSILLGGQAPYVAPAPTFEVQIGIEAQGGGKPIIVGSTNLPDGFEAIVSLFMGRKPLGQDNMVVLNGHFRAGSFSDGGDAYPSGSYTVAIDSPMNDLQPRSVQTILGHDGIRLRGPWIGPDMVGGQVVRYRATFDIR